MKKSLTTSRLAKKGKVDISSDELEQALALTKEGDEEEEDDQERECGPEQLPGVARNEATVRALGGEEVHECEHVSSPCWRDSCR